MNDYPENCLQSLPETWWEKDEHETLSRGALVNALVPFHTQAPHTLQIERASATDHSKLLMRAVPFDVNKRIAKNESPALPTAAIPPLRDADCHLLTRAKRRPCLVLGGAEDQRLCKTLTRGMPKRINHTFFIVAPFYTADQNLGKAGLSPELKERIIYAQYKHFFWDILPHDRGRESYLRLDQSQPVGHQNMAYSHLGFRLSEDAMELMDDWINWYFFDELDPEGWISGLQASAQKAEG